jgi:UDP-N-acetylmuramate--alanine ligase
MNRVHLIGIGGSGMSAIARVLLESGFQVSGSDQQPSALTEQLLEAGAQVFIGHRPENVTGAELVVRSSLSWMTTLSAGSQERWHPGA